MFKLVSPPVAIQTNVSATLVREKLFQEERTKATAIVSAAIRVAATVTTMENGENSTDKVQSDFSIVYPKGCVSIVH